MKASNIKAIREALADLLDGTCFHCDLSEDCNGVPCEKVQNAKAALAAPPRNCDLFGGDFKMLHTAWFDWTGSPSGTNPDGTVKLTFAEWLLEIAEVHHV